MKKYIQRLNSALYYALALVMCLALLPGCAKDSSSIIDSDSVGTREATLNLNISTLSTSGSRTKAVDPAVLGAAEYVIHCVRVFVFTDGVSDGASLHYPNLDTNSGSVNIKFKISGSDDAETTKKKQLFVVVNEPAGVIAQMEQVNTLDDFKKIEFAMADHFTDGKNGYTHDESFDQNSFDIPMTGFSVEFKDYLASTAEVTQNIVVKRALARVDLYLQKGGATVHNIELTKDTKLKILNTREHGYIHGTNVAVSDQLLEKVITPAATLAPKEITFIKGGAATDAPTRAFTFYLPERMCNDGGKLGFQLENLSYNGLNVTYTPIYFTAENQIKRNQVYKALCTVNEQGTDLAVDVTVEDWVDVSLDEDITTPSITLLEVSTEVVDGINLFSAGVACKQGNNDIYIGKEDGTAGYYALGDVTLASNTENPFPRWLQSVAWTPSVSAEGKHTQGKFSFAKRYEGDATERAKEYRIKVKCGSISQYVVVGYGKVVNDITVTLANWVDDETVEGDLGDDASGTTELRVPSLVRPNIRQPEDLIFISGDINYSSNGAVDIFLPTNIEGTTWGPKIEDNADFITKFNSSSTKPAWLKSAILTAEEDNKSGVFNFTTSINTTEVLNDFYIIKLQSQHVVSYMKVGYNNHIYKVGDLYPFWSDLGTAKGVMVTPTTWVQCSQSDIGVAWSVARSKCNNLKGKIWDTPALNVLLKYQPTFLPALDVELHTEDGDAGKFMILSQSESGLLFVSAGFTGYLDKLSFRCVLPLP